MAEPGIESGAGCLAFFKGGVGCIVLFIVIGLVVAATGGVVFLDVPGAMILFVIGGVIGLLLHSTYNRGKRNATKEGELE